MFTARIKLTGPEVKFYGLTKPLGGILKLYKVDDAARKRKLAALLKLLKRQKCTPAVEYERVDDEIVAVITARSVRETSRTAGGREK
jgi:hypothetical protein